MLSVRKCLSSIYLGLADLRSWQNNWAKERVIFIALGGNSPSFVRYVKLAAALRSSFETCWGTMVAYPVPDFRHWRDLTDLSVFSDMPWAEVGRIFFSLS